MAPVLEMGEGVTTSVGQLMTEGEAEVGREVERRPAASGWIVPLVYVIFAAAMAVFSRGYLEADEVMHFLNSRSMWSDWHMLLSIWGRLGCTVVFAPASLLGIVPTRLVAVGVTALVGWLTVRVLRHFLPERGGEVSWTSRHGAALVWMFLFAQPFFALNSFTVMTEMLLGVTWIGAVAVLLHGRHGTAGRSPQRGVVLAGFLLGLGGLMRPEGWFAIAAWPAVAWLWMRWGGRGGVKSGRQLWGMVIVSTLAAGSSVLFWEVLGAVAYEDWLWVIHPGHWPWALVSQYGKTGAAFVTATVVSMAGWMWLPILVGMGSFWASTWGQGKDEGGRRLSMRREGRLLLIAPVVGLYLLHGVLGSAGLFGSMSLPRYFVSISPMAAVLAVLGLREMEKVVGRNIVAAWGLRGAVIGGGLFTIFTLVMMGLLPSQPRPEQRAMDPAIRAIRERVRPEEYESRLILGHPYAIAELGMRIGTQADLRVFSPQAIQEAPSGTLMLIEEGLWLNEKRATRETIQGWGWEIDEKVAAESDAAKAAWDFPWDLGRGQHGTVRLWVKR